MPPDLSKILPGDTASVWPKVVSVLPAGAYLAGGTALVVHLHHRTSRDLDVFVPSAFDPAQVMRQLDRLGELVVTRHTGDTLNGVLDGAKIQFLYAPMACLDPKLVVAEMPIAGIRDLLADKLKVVGDRGELRDYFDLMRIEQTTAHRCEQGLVYYQTRYGVGPDDVTISHIVQALGYLDDVAHDPGLPVPRATIENYWRTRQPQIAANLRSTSYTHGRVNEGNDPTPRRRGRSR